MNCPGACATEKNFKYEANHCCSFLFLFYTLFFPFSSLHTVLSFFFFTHCSFLFLFYTLPVFFPFSFLHSVLSFFFFTHCSFLFLFYTLFFPISFFHTSFLYLFYTLFFPFSFLHTVLSIFLFTHCSFLFLFYSLLTNKGPGGHGHILTDSDRKNDIDPDPKYVLLKRVGRYLFSTRGRYGRYCT